MLSVEELRTVDDTLRVQLKLALASPMWKRLPYGVEMNPKAWRVEVLEVRPHHRLNLKLTIPWRPDPQKPAPLVFIMKIWHNKRKECLHQHLVEVNQLLGEAEKKSYQVPQPLFYDTLSHALVYPYTTAHPVSQQLPFNPSESWVQKLVKVLWGPTHA